MRTERRPRCTCDDFGDSPCPRHVCMDCGAEVEDECRCLGKTEPKTVPQDDHEPDPRFTNLLRNVNVPD